MLEPEYAFTLVKWGHGGHLMLQEAPRMSFCSLPLMPVGLLTPLKPAHQETPPMEVDLSLLAHAHRGLLCLYPSRALSSSCFNKVVGAWAWSHTDELL